jgi:hypothetical protein
VDRGVFECFDVRRVPVVRVGGAGFVGRGLRVVREGALVAGWNVKDRGGRLGLSDDGDNGGEGGEGGGISECMEIILVDRDGRLKMVRIAYSNIGSGKPFKDADAFLSAVSEASSRVESNSDLLNVFQSVTDARWHAAGLTLISGKVSIETAKSILDFLKSKHGVGIGIPSPITQMHVSPLSMNAESYSKQFIRLYSHLISFYELAINTVSKTVSFGSGVSDWDSTLLEEFRNIPLCPEMTNSSISLTQSTTESEHVISYMDFIDSFSLGDGCIVLRHNVPVARLEALAKLLFPSHGSLYKWRDSLLINDSLCMDLNCWTQLLNVIFRRGASSVTTFDVGDVSTLSGWLKLARLTCVIIEVILKRNDINALYSLLSFCWNDRHIEGAMIIAISFKTVAAKSKSEV